MTNDEIRTLIMRTSAAGLFCLAMTDIRLTQVLTGDYNIISSIMTILGLGGA